jgi:hypothetical protein
MNTQEDIQREQGAVEVQTANLRELARLVLVFDGADGEYSSDPDGKGLSEKLQVAFNDMINFAKGVAQ